MDVLPTAGDHNVYGGLYRDVELIVTEQSVIRASEAASASCRKLSPRNGPQWMRSSVSTGQRDRNLLVNLAVTTPGAAIRSSSRPQQLPACRPRASAR